MLTSEIVLGHHEHEVRNATTCIRGIIAKVKIDKTKTNRSLTSIEDQIKKIEDSLSHYVQLLNKGNHD